MIDRAFLENEKERWKIVRGWSDKEYVLKLCNESIADIDRYLERHKPPVEEYEHFRKEQSNHE